jgi:hypothetical protein
LHYPSDRIAVIDAVCIVHVPTQGGLGVYGKKSSVYAPGLSPYTAKQEELIVFSAFNYSATTTHALGEKFMDMRVLGSVPNFHVLEAMAKTAGQKWPSVEFAGEYGVPKEAAEPLIVRDKEAKLAARELENFKNEAGIGFSVQEKSLKSRSGMRKITLGSSSGSGSSGESGEVVVKARAWVWVVPIAVLAMATVRAVLVSSSGGGGGSYFPSPGRGWRRVRSYDTTSKR